MADKVNSEIPEGVVDKRQEYIASLKKNIAKATKAKHFTDSTEGQYVIDLLTDTINTHTNAILGKQLTLEEYIDKRARVDVLRKVIAILTTQADETTTAQLIDRLDAAENDG